MTKLYPKVLGRGKLLMPWLGYYLGCLHSISEYFIQVLALLLIWVPATSVEELDIPGSCFGLAQH